MSYIRYVRQYKQSYIPYFYFKGEIGLKKDKTIGIKTNRVERERIEYLCNKMDMNMSQLVIYLVDTKYFELLHKEDDINE